MSEINNIPDELRRMLEKEQEEQAIERRKRRRIMKGIMENVDKMSKIEKFDETKYKTDELEEIDDHFRNLMLAILK